MQRMRDRLGVSLLLWGVLSTSGLLADSRPVPVAADVSYGPHPHQLMDIYVPTKGNGPFPVLIWYGGIWEPSKHVPDLNHFLPEQIAVIGVQTRTLTDGMKEQATPPVSYVMNDACRAVQFVRWNAAKWNLDPQRIAAGGSSQGALPALYVGGAADHADPTSDDPVARVSSRVTCVAAHRSQPSIDPQRMQQWVPGVKWGAPSLGCGFEESLKRRDELLPLIEKWSPDALLRQGAAPIYFENNWGLAVPQAKSADKQSDTDFSPVTKGQRVFTCGHSFHVFVYRLVDEMAEAAGIQDHESAGISRIGGSRVIQHWDVPEEKNEAKAALLAGKVDVLTLSPIWLPDEGIKEFARLGSEHNPDLRITVQEFWLPNDEYVPVYPLQTRKQVDHNATDLAELRKQNALYCRDMEDFVRGLNKRLGKNAVLIVPVGQASIALREKIVAGQAPGLKAQWDLFRDCWGHAQPPLQVLAGYCHFAVIYRRSPVGLPLPSDLARAKNLTQKDELNRLLQELAWDAVIHHPLSGVKADPQSE